MPAPRQLSQDHVARLQAHFRRLTGALPSVMASPPTITKATDYATSSISNNVFIPLTDARLGVARQGMLHVGMTGALNDGVTRNFYDGQGFGKVTGQAVNELIISTWSDAPVIEVVCSRIDRAMAMVDGQLVAASSITTMSSTGRYIIKFDFGSAASNGRDISLFFGGSSPYVAGIYVGVIYNVCPGSLSPSGKRPFFTFQTDSYGALTSATSSICGDIAKRLGGGAYLVDGVGGSGYSQSNSGASPSTNAFINRSTPGDPAYSLDASLLPDMDFILGGIKDAQAISVSSVLAVLQAHRALWPSTIICVSGNWRPAMLAKSQIIQATIDAACQQLSAPWIQVDNVNGLYRNSSGRSGSLGAVGFQTGTGKVSATVGDGNGDIYLSSDGTHAQEPDGPTYLAARVVSGAIPAVLEL